MPEILPDHVPSPRTPLVWDGTRYRAVRGHTDGTLQVRGEDQHFSIECVVVERADDTVSGADGYLDSDPVPAGRYWVITNIATRLDPRASTSHLLSLQHAPTSIEVAEHVGAFGISEWQFWQGHLCMDAADVIRVTFTGALAGDIARVHINGYQMTIET